MHSRMSLGFQSRRTLTAVVHYTKRLDLANSKKAIPNNFVITACGSAMIESLVESTILMKMSLNVNILCTEKRDSFFVRVSISSKKRTRISHKLQFNNWSVTTSAFIQFSLSSDDGNSSRVVYGCCRQGESSSRLCCKCRI
jgi:hypothetical protein